MSQEASQRPHCVNCDDTGWVDDPTACGDIECCNPLAPCWCYYEREDDDNDD